MGGDRGVGRKEYSLDTGGRVEVFDDERATQILELTLVEDDHLVVRFLPMFFREPATDT